MNNEQLTMNNERVTPKKIVLLSSFFFLFSFVVISCENTFVNSILPDRTKKTNYIVTFDKNHEDATEADPKTVKVTPPKTTVGTLPKEPERTGWKFTDWNTKPDGNGTTFTADTKVKKSVTVYAQWEQNKVFTVDLNISGKAEDDSVDLSPPSGEAGDTVTINYTVGNSKYNNLLAFTGTTATIAPVTSAESGAKTYTINEADATDGSITINAVFTHNDDFTVALNISGNVSGDSVTLLPGTGEPGQTVTINYTVANSKHNNRLDFSGTTVPIDPVNSAGSGTRTYGINETDAAAGRIITINAQFTHTDKEIDTIAFEDTHNESKTYGDSRFTKAITNTGSGTGTISYSSGTPAVATVSATGEVTILREGSTIITATKAEDATYAAAEARYTLTVSALQLTISDPVVTTTKTYNGNTTAAVTAGTLDNVVDGDTVNVTAAATYNSADVATANEITVVYTITGASASNYFKPVNYPVAGTITKADGATLASAPTGTATSLTTSSSITVTPVTPPANGQTVEYAISNSEATPSDGWQSGISFPVVPQTEYYIHARAAENANYNAGAVRSSAKITIPVFDLNKATVIDFEADAIGKTYSATQGNNSVAKVAVASDPAHSGQKSLQITTGGSPAWNQAAIIPIHLPDELQKYKSFSFSFYLVSGTSNVDRQVMVYAAGSAGTFIQYGFGNPAGNANQFAANLVGQTPNVSFSDTGKWIDYTIVNNPGSAISTLQGDIFIAIGINNDTVLDYYVDNLTFTLKDEFVAQTPFISPTTATFDKKTPAEITVTMTLFGRSLQNIMNMSTPLTNNDYTVSGNLATLEQEYFEELPTGQVTLTFNFSGGGIRTLTVNVRDSGVEVTSFDFTTLTSVDVDYNTVSGSTITATVQNGVLHVKKTGSYSNMVFILTFKLGDNKNLSNFTGVKVKIRGTDGDIQGNKNLTIESVGANNNTRTALTAPTGFSLNDKEWNVRSIPFTAANPTLSALTGDVKIAFGLNNTNPNDYEFEYIELY